MSKDYVEPPLVPLLDMEELKSWPFFRAVIAEFVATLLFLYVTVATVISHKKQANQCDGVGLLGISLAFGGMIFVLVYCTAGISGWIFWVGPFIGALLAAAYHQYVLRASATIGLGSFRSNPAT
ncbi:hypothetical protein C1H46_028667 [Malus baccata]|uniref:Aquaporin n=1 Tax=Malus baccata TaxID=106549 RepID=A0A540LH00_MALBA|nr:hypothetical protein C1H46_028667 [Malus baccata]